MDSYVVDYKVEVKSETKEEQEQFWTDFQAFMKERNTDNWKFFYVMDRGPLQFLPGFDTLERWETEGGRD